MTGRGNADNLRRAAAAKRTAATERADAGLRHLVKNGERITFEAVAAAAGVSKDFLYRTPALRQRIEQLRAQQSSTTPAPLADPATQDVSSIVRTLTLKLAHERSRYRAEMAELKAALAAAHGELLTLKRRHAAPDCSGHPRPNASVEGI